jgi:hypothetical protein
MKCLHIEKGTYNPCKLPKTFKICKNVPNWVSNAKEMC